MTVTELIGRLQTVVAHTVGGEDLLVTVEDCSTGREHVAIDFETSFGGQLGQRRVVIQFASGDET